MRVQKKRKKKQQNKTKQNKTKIEPVEHAKTIQSTLIVSVTVNIVPWANAPQVQALT
jgi:hypothetical protein